VIGSSLPLAFAPLLAFFGNAFPSAYEAFNYFECTAWITIAIVLPFWFRACPPEKRGVIARASITFVVFGVSDYLEAPTHGRLPWWLWTWKLTCAAYLLKCRYDFIGREKFRWRDRTNILALACFCAVLLAMFLQYYFRDILSEAD
jgi:hypothetical protein